MDMESSLMLQNQIRDNSDELQNFLRDMDHWEKDMKKKEAELKLMNISDEQLQECPPIRNSLSRSKKRNRHKKNKDKPSPTEETPSEAKVRISAYNYQAWDKFDVESELKRVDGEEKESSASESSDEEEEEVMTVQSKKQLAIIKKDNGNKYFKEGSFDSAINCYTLGMELDPENALLPANRAMAFLKKEQYQAAENDCTLCLSLDPTYVKAYLRRGSARLGLKKLHLAQEDFLNVLQLEPDNRQAKAEIEKVNQAMRKELSKFNKEVEDSMKPNSFNIEVMEEGEKAEKLKKQGGVTTLDVPDEEDFAMVIPTITPPSNEETKASTERDAPVEKIDTMLHKTSLDLNEVVKDNNDVALLWKPSLPPVPTTAFQFYTHWQHISKHPELKYSYLKQLPAESMQVLFQHQIEPELLPEILHTLSTSFIENGDDVYYYLKYLATAGRFSFTLMFLSEAEKQDIKKMKSYLETSGYDPKDVNAVMGLYNL